VINLKLKANIGEREHPVLSLLKIFLLLWAGSFFVYNLEGQLSNTLYFGFVFILFLLSKNNIFWIAFFWIIILSPWGLFYYRWNNWIITLTPTVGISYISILPFILIFKYIIIERGHGLRLTYNFLNRFYKIFYYYIVFMIIWGGFYGYSIKQIPFLLTYLSPFFLFYTIPLLFNSKQLISLNRIIFVFCIFQTLTLIIDLATKGAFLNFISFGSELLAGTVREESLTRMTGGIFISLYSFILGLYYIIRRRQEFSYSFLWFVILMALLYILNSGTRGWMIATGFIMISFLFIFKKNIFHSSRILITGLTIIILFIFILPTSVKQNMNASINRLSTVDAILEGDMTAEGTVQRWEVRGPQVLTRFNESPLFGFGYSKITFQYADNHVGNHLLLLSSGYVGFIILYLSVISLIFYLIKLNFKGIAPGSNIFAIALIGIIIIHSTSRNMISFLMPADTAFFIALIFNHIIASIENPFHLKDNSSF
jgi:hypothetical protein